MFLNVNSTCYTVLIKKKLNVNEKTIINYSNQILKTFDIK